MKLKTLVIATAALICSANVMANTLPETTAPAGLAQELQLTKAQQDNIIKLHADAQICMRNIDVSKLDPTLIRNMIKTGKVDEPVLSKQLDALGVVKKQASICRVKYYAAVSNSLTPEQKKKFMEIQGQQAQ